MSDDTTATAEDPTPAALLDEITRLREHARTARHAYWFPLVLFGVLTLTALPLAFVEQDAVTNYREYGFDLFNLIGWYWLLVLPGGYVATLLWYRRHALRVGVATATRGFLVAGIVGAIITILAFVEYRFGWFWPTTAPVVTHRFLLTILGIAGGLLVLARLERSASLAIIAVLAAAAAWIPDLVALSPPDILVRAWYAGVRPEMAVSPLILLISGAVVARRQRQPVAGR